MIKNLNCSDIHFDPERLDIWEIVSKSIIKAAKDNNVDYVSFAGDLWKSVTTNNTKGGVGYVLDFIKELLKICPCCGVEGTPSHDSPGSYRILEEVGFVLLKPGMVYGYFKDSRSIKNINLSIIKDGLGNDIYHPTHQRPDSILFGVPELNKNNIQAKLSLSAEEANGKAVELFESYMDSYVAPMRLQYSDIPAHMIFHGNISDYRKENTSDIIMRSSDIVLHSEIFERTNLTRVSAGHIHKPWESEVCSMGYSGSPGLNWGEVGFVPAMNFVRMERVVRGTANGKPEEGFACKVMRIPYGTPIRKKVYSLDDIIPDLNTAYWLVSDDPESVLPEGIHPWSRITINEKNNKSTRRATEEEISQTTSIWDLALKLNPDLDESLKPKFELLQEKTKKEVVQQVNVDILSIEVHGCKFFDGNIATLDIESMNTGLTAITGEINGKQNGIGKSGIASFCSPYPVVVGKDTKSGRRSALKDFFNKKGAKVVKRINCNGVLHEHLITIKSPHTKSGGKVECYLTIGGEPQLDKGTFDEMMAMCESLYGSYEDYLLTSFYVQPLQGKSGSSLMSANMTEIRDLVMGIAGIDRTKEREFANNEIEKLKKQLKDVESKIEYAKEHLDDKEIFTEKSKEISKKIKELIKSINRNNESGKEAKKAYDNLVESQKINNNKKISLKLKKENLSSIESNINDLSGKIESAEKLISNIPESIETVKKHDSDKKVFDEYSRKKTDYDNYVQKLDIYDKQISSLEAKKNLIEIPNSEDLLKEIAQHQKMVDNAASNKKLTDSYNDDLKEYESLKTEYENELTRLEQEGNSLCDKIKSQKEIILSKSNSCQECGYLSPDIKTQIEEHNKKVEDFENLYEENRNFYNNLDFSEKEPEEPKLEPENPKSAISLITCQNSLNGIQGLKDRIEEIESDIQSINQDKELLQKIDRPEDPGIKLQPDFMIEALRVKIEESESKKTDITSWKLEVQNLKSNKSRLKKEIDDIKIDHEIDLKVQNSDSVLKELRKKAQDLREEGLKLEADKKAANLKVTEIEKEEKRISDMEDSVRLQLISRDEWQEVASLLGANKIPALELEIMLDSIDLQATRILAPYQDGQYSFRTSTQNDKGTDKFDILIHDSVSGMEKSFMEFSPGVKIFLSDSYVKSLLLRRSSYNYNPDIKDEADGPVGPKHLSEYYNVQERYYRKNPDKKVLVISHHTESKAYIENSIDIKEIRNIV